jgi:hypothetical protein
MKLFRPAILSVAAALALAACGGGGSGSDSIVPPPIQVSSSAQPQLGAFSAGATVTYLRPDGTTLGSALTDATGKATVDLGSYTGPFTVRVTGGPGVTYFDEADGSLKPFGAGATLLAIVKGSAGGPNSIGVTPLTHAAARLAGVSAASPGLGNRTAADIDTANGQIAAMFGLPAGFDITKPPTPIAAGATSLSGTSDAATYAALLSALAIQARANNTNPLAAAEAFGTALASTAPGTASTALALILADIRTLLSGGAVGGFTLAGSLTLGSDLLGKLTGLAPQVLINGRVPLPGEVVDRVTPPPSTLPICPTGATGATGGTGGTGGSGGSGLGSVQIACQPA